MTRKLMTKSPTSEVILLRAASDEDGHDLCEIETVRPEQQGAARDLHRLRRSPDRRSRSPPERRAGLAAAGRWREGRRRGGRSVGDLHRRRTGLLIGAPGRARAGAAHRSAARAARWRDRGRRPTLRSLGCVFIKSSSRVRFRAKRTPEPTSPNDRV
jgi:hypothetical protein